MIRVTFDVELAKKITNGDVEGRIVTRNGESVRIVCWNFKRFNHRNYILGIIDRGGEEVSWIFNLKGQVNSELESKNDLMIEIPEYMTFKDGDIATLGWESDDGEFCEWITILKNIEVDKYNILTEDYVTVCLKCDTEDCFPIEFDCTSDGARWVRKPTEPEKQKLIEALKESKEPKAKECLKKLGIEQKPEYELKPFDKVLVRNSECEKWRVEIFSHNDSICKYLHVCLKNSYSMCIPYNEKTKHLLGTTDNWEGNK